MTGIIAPPEDEPAPFLARLPRIDPIPEGGDARWVVLPLPGAEGHAPLMEELVASRADGKNSFSWM